MNQTEREILTLLDLAPDAMTARELYDSDRISVDAMAPVSRAMYGLRNAGRVAAVGSRPAGRGRGARHQTTYQITDDGRAALAERVPAAPVASVPPFAADPDPEAPPAHDAILARIVEHLGEPSGPVPDAEIHATRLRALGQWPALDQSVSDWLHALADLLDPRDLEATV